MRRVFFLRCALLLAACTGDAERPFSFRGITPGMSAQGFEAAAAAAGSTIECRPLEAPPVRAGQLCSSPDTSRSMLRVAGTVEAGLVPYVVVREALTSPAGYDRLNREWGLPDTAIGSARRWTSGRWMANADTADGILTVWLSDTATEALVARASARELWQMSGRDTLPYFSDEAAVLDSLGAALGGRPAPIPAAELTSKPSVRSCTNVSAPPRLARVDGVVIVAYVVDANGLVEPSSIRILQASHAGLVGSAAATVRSCTFDPGRRGTQPVRTLVTQRVTFRPPPPQNR